MQKVETLDEIKNNFISKISKLPWFNDPKWSVIIKEAKDILEMDKYKNYDKKGS